MKLDFFKVMQIVSLGISAAESFKGKKGKEKLDHAIDVADMMLPQLETLVGKDLLKDERIRPFAEQYINAAITFKNVVENVKGLKAEPTS